MGSDQGLLVSPGLLMKCLGIDEKDALNCLLRDEARRLPLEVSPWARRLAEEAETNDPNHSESDSTKNNLGQASPKEDGISSTQPSVAAPPLQPERATSITGELSTSVIPHNPTLSSAKPVKSSPETDNPAKEASLDLVHP